MSGLPYQRWLSGLRRQQRELIPSILPDLLSDKPAVEAVVSGHKTHLLRESVSSDSQESRGGGKQFCWYIKQSQAPVMKQWHSQAMLRSQSHEEIVCDIRWVGSEIQPKLGNLGDDYNGQLPFGLVHLGSIVSGGVWDHKESRLLD